MVATKGKTLGVCTHCGLPKPRKVDHVFPRCLWVGPSEERPVIVRSCEGCNCRSEEGLLKSFFAMFDERLAAERLPALTHRQGGGDRRSFLGIRTPDIRVAYAEERVTRLLKKMFQGLRRHLLDSEWMFVPADEVAVFSVVKQGGELVTRLLPLRVGGPNPGYTVPTGLECPPVGHRFRDFHFGLCEPDVVSFRYGRPYCGNELALFALFTPGSGT